MTVSCAPNDFQAKLIRHPPARRLAPDLAICFELRRSSIIVQDIRNERGASPTQGSKEGSSCGRDQFRRPERRNLRASWSKRRRQDYNDQDVMHPNHSHVRRCLHQWTQRRQGPAESTREFRRDVDRRTNLILEVDWARESRVFLSPVPYGSLRREKTHRWIA